MESKKALTDPLGPSVVKLLIAALCFAVLIGLGFKVWGAYTNSGDLEKAQRSMASITDALAVFESGEEIIMIFPPEGWYLESYSVQDEGHPQGVCVGEEYCLCICNDELCRNSFYCRGVENYLLIGASLFDKENNEFITLFPPVPGIYYPKGVPKEVLSGKIHASQVRLRVRWSETSGDVIKLDIVVDGISQKEIEEFKKSPGYIVWENE